jgi:hypothetical protein
VAGWRRQFRTESIRLGKLSTRSSLQFEPPLRSSHGNLRVCLEVGRLAQDLKGLAKAITWETAWKSSGVAEKPLFRKQSAFPFPIGHASTIGNGQGRSKNWRRYPT